jgi:hypothetical protein
VCLVTVCFFALLLMVSGQVWMVVGSYIFVVRSIQTPSLYHVSTTG